MRKALHDPRKTGATGTDHRSAKGSVKAPMATVSDSFRVRNTGGVCALDGRLSRWRGRPSIDFKTSRRAGTPRDSPAKRTSAAIVKRKRRARLDPKSGSKFGGAAKALNRLGPQRPRTRHPPCGPWERSSRPVLRRACEGIWADERLFAVPFRGWSADGPRVVPQWRVASEGAGARLHASGCAVTLPCGRRPLKPRRPPHRPLDAAADA